MIEKNYPEEIYSPVWGLNPHNPECKSITSAAIEKAYDLGRTHAADPLEGYSNLTEAIKDGAGIDWEKLDGREIRMVNEDGREICGYKMESEEGAASGNRILSTDKPISGKFLSAEINESYRGHRGWTLYIKGEVPVKRKTADELEPGTEFFGVLKTDEPEGVLPEKMMRTQAHVLHLDDYTISQLSPRHFEVTKVTGTFGGDK